MKATVILIAITLCSCGENPYTCKQAPDQPIVAFVVALTTGGEGSDQNIYFCYQRKSGDDGCFNLDGPGNDFEAGNTDNFRCTPDPAIAAGDFDTFHIENGGGQLFEMDWELDGVKVEAELEDGQTVLLYEEKNIGDNLYEDDKWKPNPDCKF